MKPFDCQKKSIRMGDQHSLKSDDGFHSKMYLKSHKKLQLFFFSIFHPNFKLLIIFHFSSSPQLEDWSPPPPPRHSTTWLPPAPLQWAGGWPPPTRPCPSKRWWTSTSPQGPRGQEDPLEWSITLLSVSARRTPCRGRRAPAQGTSVKRRQRVCGAASHCQGCSHRVDTLFTSYPPPMACCVSTPCARAGRWQSVHASGFIIELVSSVLWHASCPCDVSVIFSTVSPPATPSLIAFKHLWSACFCFLFFTWTRPDWS